MTPAPPPPRALISWAHVDPSWKSETRDSQAKARKDAVLRLGATLRSSGVDADLDLYHATEGVDWTRWGPGKVADCDVVLVVVSEAWKEAWEGRGDPTRGAGAAAEASALRSIEARDRSLFLKKTRLVLLPGSASDVIPDGLNGVPRYTLATIDAVGVEQLLRDLSGQAEHPMPPLGQLPVLPPSLLGQDSVAVAGTSAVVTRRARLESALEALPNPAREDDPKVPWLQERERVEDQLEELNTTDATPPPHGWLCDTCGQIIKRARDGYVVWRKPTAQAPTADYRIIHQGQCDPGSSAGFTSSLALTDLLGAEGLAWLLAWLSPGPLLGPSDPQPPQDLDAYVDLVRRLQTPWYEQARPRFQDTKVLQDLAGANEIYPYLPTTLRRIAERDLG